MYPSVIKTFPDEKSSDNYPGDKLTAHTIVAREILETYFCRDAPLVPDFQSPEHSYRDAWTRLLDTIIDNTIKEYDRRDALRRKLMETNNPGYIARISSALGLSDPKKEIEKLYGQLSEVVGNLDRVKYNLSNKLDGKIHVSKDRVQKILNQIQIQDKKMKSSPDQEVLDVADPPIIDPEE